MQVGREHDRGCPGASMTGLLWHGPAMRKRIGVTALVLGAVIALGAWIFVFSPYQVMPEARVALGSDSRVTVTTDPWLTFSPRDGPPDTGLVLYTGARVPPEAYAPMARRIASEGHLVVVPRLPLNLAIFDAGAAAAVIAAHPEVDAWAIGGRSLGGALAARFARDSADVEGLVLLAAYPEEGLDLTDASLEVLVVSGSMDAIAISAEIRDGLGRLPAASRLVEVAGGNHARFGWYGEQPGDGVATISRQDQIATTATATIDLLRMIARR